MQEAYYHLAIFGAVPSDVLTAVEYELRSRLAELQLELGQEVSWYVGAPEDFKGEGEQCTAALCFPLEEQSERAVVQLMKDGIPIIPVATQKSTLPQEFSVRLAKLNGLSLDMDSASTLALSLLECASLLPRQRKVFLSYRRTESTDAALQLYAALSERLFDVFLDTHEILPGEHFQDVLWQKLCDSDVMLYLDTPDYFGSRWTTAEFGRAGWRGVALLRAGWPGVDMDSRSQYTTNLALAAEDFCADKTKLTDEAILKICSAVENLRAESVATRYKYLIDSLRVSVGRAKGKLEGVSLRRSLIATTWNDKKIAIYPALGVPTTYTLHAATEDNHPPPVAVVYDDIGIQERKWQNHMEWIADYVKGDVRLISMYGAGWNFEDWN